MQQPIPLAVSRDRIDGADRRNRRDWASRISRISGRNRRNRRNWRNWRNWGDRIHWTYRAYRAYRAQWRDWITLRDRCGPATLFDGIRDHVHGRRKPVAYRGRYPAPGHRRKHHHLHEHYRAGLPGQLCERERDHFGDDAANRMHDIWDRLQARADRDIRIDMANNHRWRGGRVRFVERVDSRRSDALFV
jgi:hypothetical protein